MVLLSVTNTAQIFSGRLKTHRDYPNLESTFSSTSICPFNKAMCVLEEETEHCSPRFTFLSMMDKMLICFSGILFHIIFLLMRSQDYFPLTKDYPRIAADCYKSKRGCSSPKGRLGTRVSQVSRVALLITIHRSQILGHTCTGDIKSWHLPVPRDQFPLELLQRSLSIR